METKLLPLSQGKFAIVDAADFDWLNQWKWWYHKDGRALRTDHNGGNPKNLRLHRVIMNAPKGSSVDHIDRNALNNTRANLRICTTAENRRNNKKFSNNTSGHKGVSWDKVNQKWRAYIVVNYRQTHLGYFTDVEEAAKAYDEAAIRLHGEFKSTNKEMGTYGS